MQFLKTFEEFGKKENAFVIKVERDDSVEPKRFANGKYLNFFVRIYLDINFTSNANIYRFEDISFVKYQLDSSYDEPVRLAENPMSNFEIKVWTYGFYPVQAFVFPKLGPSFTLNGFVSFPVSSEEKEKNKSQVE